MKQNIQNNRLKLESFNVIEIEKEELLSFEGGAWLADIIEGILCGCGRIGTSSGGTGMPAGGMYYRAPKGSW